MVKESYRFDPLNVEAIFWIGYLSPEAVFILSNLGREKDAEKRRKLFKDYEIQHKEKFGKGWIFGF